MPRRSIRPFAPLVFAALLGAWTTFAGCSSHQHESATAVAPERPTPRPRGPNSGDGSFTILHVNDVYRLEGLEQGARGGFARVRTLRADLERQGPVLMLHGGDFLFPSVIGKYLRGRAMIEAMNRLDGDATAFDGRLFATYGNHEFDDKDPGLVLGRVAQSDFTWLTANVEYKTSPDAAPEPFDERVRRSSQMSVLELGGIRVGLFGLTIDDERAPWLDYGAEAATRSRRVREILDALRAQGAQAIVAVTHQNIDQDEALAREFPEIDLVCGGHEHMALEAKIEHADGRVTRVVKADADAITALVIRVTRKAGQLTVEPEWRTLDGTVASDPAMAAFVGESMERLSQAILRSTGKTWDTLYATTENALEGLEPKIRTRETALGNFLSDVLRERLKADFGFVNGGAIRINDDIPAGGMVRAYELEGIFYFPNRAVAFEVSGQQVLAMLRNSVERAEIGEGRFLQVSGLRFRYRPVPDSGDGPRRHFTLDAADVEVGTPATGFRPLELERNYTAASLDYLWEFGYRDGFADFAKGKGGTSPARVESESPLWRTLTEDALLALPDRRVMTRIEGRIVKQE
jgi:2',3'-cyclic-nucleotide 2'-phosphodiesterase (5'-nucleotidase family)